MKYILHPQSDNKLSISYVVEEHLEYFLTTLDTQVYSIVETLSNINNDFFDAYEFDAELGAKVNIEKAKAIHLDKFRSARTPLLATLDVSFMRAVEAGNADLQKEIAVKKQALRDVTSIELPNTLDKIKATWPEVLK
jgi:hypothetical protein